MSDKLDQFGFTPEKANEFDFVPDNKAELEGFVRDLGEKTTPFEAFAKKGAHSASLGFLDELTGLIGGGADYLAQEAGMFQPTKEDIASTMSPDMLQKLEGRIEPVEVPKKGPIEIYKQYRDMQRKALQEAEQEHPVASFAGDIAGGIMMPGMGVGMGAGKAGSLAAKTARGSLAAAPVSAAVGAGISEEETLAGVAEDAAKTASLGMLMGGAIPAIGAAGSGVKGLAKKAGDSDLAKIYKAYAKGERLSDDVIENFRKLKDLGGDVTSELSSRSKVAGQELQDVLKKASETTDPVEVSGLLSEAKARLQALSKDPNPDVEASAKKVIGVIDNILEGKEVTKLMPTKSLEEQAIKKEEDILKAYKKLQEKRAKTMMEDPGEVAGQKLAKKRAGLEASSEKPPRLGPEEQFLSSDDIPVLRQQKGDAGFITQIMDDPNLTPIDIATDPESGLKYFSYMNQSTGKVESAFLPDDTSLFSKLRPTKVREGGKAALTPEELIQAKRSFAEMTPIVDPAMSKQVGREAVGITKALDELLPPEAQAKSKEVSDLMGVFGQLTGRGPSDVLDAAEKTKMRERLGALMLEASPEVKTRTQLEDILMGFADPTRPERAVKGLQDIAPDLAARIRNEAPEIAEKIRLGIAIDPRELGTISPDLRGQIAAQFGGGIGILRKGAAVAGSTSKAISDSMSKMSEELVSMSPEALNNVVERLYGMGSTTSRSLGDALGKAMAKDKRGRQAVMFGIMQNPAYREILQELNDEKRELGDDFR